MPLQEDFGESLISEIEVKYPKTAEEFKKIQKQQYRVFCRKLHDYGPYNVTLGREIKTENDVKTGLTVIGIRCTEKVQRLINMLFYSNSELNTHNEPLVDSFDDISVYGIIAQIINNKRWGK